QTHSRVRYSFRAQRRLDKSARKGRIYVRRPVATKRDQRRSGFGSIHVRQDRRKYLTLPSVTTQLSSTKTGSKRVYSCRFLRRLSSFVWRVIRSMLCSAVELRQTTHK